MEFCKKKMKNCCTIYFKTETSAQKIAGRESSREARHFVFKTFRDFPSREPQVSVRVAANFFQNSRNFILQFSRTVSWGTACDTNFQNLPETFFKS